MTCPNCHSSEHVETTHDDRYFCVTCQYVFDPSTEPRLVEPVERRRRDSDG